MIKSEFKFQIIYIYIYSFIKVYMILYGVFLSVICLNFFPNDKNFSTRLPFGRILNKT